MPATSRAATRFHIFVNHLLRVYSSQVLVSRLEMVFEGSGPDSIHKYYTHKGLRLLDIYTVPLAIHVKMLVALPALLKQLAHAVGSLNLGPAVLHRESAVLS